MYFTVLTVYLMTYKKRGDWKDENEDSSRSGNHPTQPAPVVNKLKLYRGVESHAVNAPQYLLLHLRDNHVDVATRAIDVRYAVLAICFSSNFFSNIFRNRIVVCKFHCIACTPTGH